MGLFSNLVLLKIEVRNCGASMQFTSKVAFIIGKEKYLIKKKDTLSKFHRYTGGKKKLENIVNYFVGLSYYSVKQIPGSNSLNAL